MSKFLTLVVTTTMFGGFNVLSQNQTKINCEDKVPIPQDNVKYKKIDDPTLQLKMVSVLTRHGARCPLSKSTELHEYKCYPSYLQHIKDKGETMPLNFSKNYLENDKEHAKDTICYTGQLTKLGIQQLEKIGSEFRELYVIQHNLLSRTFKQEELYIRSTDSPRTQESAQSLFRGLYPKSASPDKVVDLYILPEGNENMYPHPSKCPRLRKQRQEFENYIQTIPNFKRDRENLSKEIEKAGLKNKGSWGGLFNSIDCKKYAGIKFSEKLTPKLLSEVSKASGYEFYILNHDKIASRLSIGRFIGDFSSLIEKRATSNNPVKFALYSGHDSSVGAFLNAYQVFDFHHPQMASTIVVELYKSDEFKPKKNTKNDLDNYWVRMLYNNTELKLPECKKVAVNDGTLCPLSKFMEISRSLVPHNYVDECRA